MAAQSRRTSTSLREELVERGYRFDFFQAVRLLTRWFPDRQPVGRRSSPSQEVVRFKSHLSLGFPPSAIKQIRASKHDQRPIEMTVAFMGLAGIQGVLPRRLLCHASQIIFSQQGQQEMSGAHSCRAIFN